MFCFQDEQNAKGAGCTDTAQLQDQLTGALIGLARATDGNEHLISESSTAVVVESLLATLTNCNADDDALKTLIKRVEEEKRKMVPNCFECASPCGRTSDYNMQKLWNAHEDIRSLKSLILFGIRAMAAYAYHAAARGYHEKCVDDFFYKALIVIGMDDFGTEELQPIVLELGKINLMCRAMLDKACTEPEA